MHWLLKDAVSDELERGGYELYFEPWESPMKRLSWSFYRPDVFGVSVKEEELKMVFAECETEPNISKVYNKTSKIRRWLSFQKKLCEKHDLCFLLVIPSGKLRRVNTSSVRRLWTIWIMNDHGAIFHKIPRTTAFSSRPNFNRDNS